jgi:hypothetical protein
MKRNDRMFFWQYWCRRTCPGLGVTEELTVWVSQRGAEGRRTFQTEGTRDRVQRSWDRMVVTLLWFVSLVAPFLSPWHWTCSSLVEHNWNDMNKACLIAEAQGFLCPITSVSWQHMLWWKPPSINMSGIVRQWKGGGRLGWDSHLDSGTRCS